MTQWELGLVGPAQSDDLYHFAGRNGDRPQCVPEEIRQMTGQQRLERILHEERIRAFAPFGTTTACVCFSESPPNHLGHLIQTGRFSPWGIVTSRATLLKLEGGAVAYVPDAGYARFKRCGLEHWAVRTGTAQRGCTSGSGACPPRREDAQLARCARSWWATPRGDLPR
ncbi:hypothetical protein [Streptomyces diastatochromogenes]|uniref:Uncharacterized protein n=1 Tax=Streptomyces diastatochromogenes TaxID=42236 RepID=A0A233SWE2_STRDA|nr:hypothetical protein [Streptomyces diastatochromogenes]MCZ0989126.1 hypothetical protein [Streptomyces diastatochromogenes]OXY99958.1 hypothetical protein BEK98_01815 [Streptomyces diastatochromogenes]